MPSSHLMMEFLHGPGWTSILHRSTVPSEPGTGGAIAFHILTELEANPSPLQFIPSEMATKFEEIPVLVLMLRSAPTPWLTLLLFLQKILLIKFHVYSSDILKSTQNLKKKSSSWFGSLLVNVQSMKIVQIFVCFSESLNFK